MANRRGAEIDGREVPALDRRIGIIRAQCLDRVERRDGIVAKTHPADGKAHLVVVRPERGPARVQTWWGKRLQRAQLRAMVAGRLAVPIQELGKRPVAACEQVAHRQGAGGGVRQNASAGRAITVAAPALIWWLSEVVCGSTRAR